MPSTPASEDEAHDILAAEAFAVPAPDSGLRHTDAVELPADPSGIPEPHDVLAADEFAFPAPSKRTARGAVSSRSRSRLGASAAAIGGVAGVLLLRARRRR